MNATGIMGISRDIIERKELEKKNQQLAMMVEYSDESIVGLDLNQRVTVWNRGAELLYGYTAEEMIGAPTSSSIPPELEDETRLMQDRVMKSGQVTRYETTRLCKDGSRIMVAITLSAIFDAEGRIAGIASIARNITEQKRLEEELLNSERKLADIIDFLPDATFAVDTEGRVIIWNKAIVRMTGIPAAQMIGRGNHACAIPFYGEPRLQLIDFILMGCEIIPDRYSNVTYEGDTLSAEVFCNALNNNEGAWVVSKVSPLHDQVGNIIGTIESIRDITLQKLLGASLIESEKKFHLLFDRSADGNLILENGRFVECNEAALQIAGFTVKEQLLGLRPSDIAPEYQPDGESSASKAERLIDFAQEKGFHQFEWVSNRFDGSELTLDIMLTEIPVMGKRLLHVNWRDISKRKYSEKALMESEQRYRYLVENAREAIFVVQEGLISFSNRAGFEISGYSEQELFSKPFVELIHPGDRARIENIHLKFLSGKKAESRYLFRIITKDGDCRWLEQHVALVSFDGKPATLCLAYDITKRKNAAEALRESERRLSEIIEFLPDATFVIDEEGQIVIWNHAIEQMTGKTKKQMLGCRNYEYAFPFYGCRRPILIDLAFNKREEISDEYISAVRNGDTIMAKSFTPSLYQGNGAYLFGVATLLRNEKGKIVGAIESIRDITEGKRVEEEYLSEKEFTETLLESLPGIFYLYSYPELRLIRWNKSHETIFGFSPEEMKDRSILAWHLPENKEKVLKTIMEEWDKGVGNLEAPMLAKNGRLIPFLMTGVKFEIMKKKYLMGVGLDISSSKNAEEEKVKLEEKFQQVQKMESVGRLAGGIAHDFNNLLTVILGYCDILVNRSQGADMDALGEIRGAAERAATLTGQLLAFSRRQILQPQAISLNLTIMNMQTMLKRLIGEDVEISVKARRGEWLVLVDPGKLEQVVMNLAVNARDAMPSGGKLKIETSNIIFDRSFTSPHPEICEGEYVLLTVSDTGEGMDRSVLPHIFEPFFTTKEIGKGTGLGLATVYGIIKQSHGFIFCDSQAGRGTTFTIYLPRILEKTELDAPMSASVSQSQGGMESILLVEDDDGIRGLARLILSEAGYSVVSTRNGSEALAALTDRIDLLITDVVMPDMDGSIVAEQVTTRYPGIKVLYMSGYTDDLIVHYGVLDENLRLLQKPFSAEELLRAVREVLDEE
ncbi:MAG: PAS domain S-box protein [Rectinemataceae bacterium]